MWALRRASTQLKNRGLTSGATRICCVKTEIDRYYFENHYAGIIESRKGLLDAMLYSTRSYSASSSSSHSYMEFRSFSSDAGAKSEDQGDDLDDAFSELESPHAELGGIDDEILKSESELSEGESIAELETIDIETEKKSPKTRPTSAMIKAILAAPASPVSTVLDKWVEAGNEVTQTEIQLTLSTLRRRKMFFKALQFSEWLESKGHFVATESNYASRVDLIAKVRGIFKAEVYVGKIPKSLRGEIIYRTLLANFVSADNVKKSEDLFNTMKKNFPITIFTFNQLMLLYKKNNQKKIADVLLLMEKENIKPSLFTYQMLIDIKGQSNDIDGMEQVVEAMKSDGLEPNTKIRLTLARHYTTNKLTDKAEAILKEMEGGDLVKNRWACQFLLTSYAYIGKDDDVERIWKVCESNPRFGECVAAIEAFGQIKRIEDAESAFDKLVANVKRPTSKHFAALIKVYADHKMLAKGQELIKRMSESGCTVGPLAWDALVRLYVGAGEVEKADSILEKAIKQRQGKPLSNTFLAILDGYANRGDVHGAEKIFLKMKQAGYTLRLRPFRALLYAYVNAKTPAYGFIDRMKCENVIPNKVVTDLLARTDVFRKSPVAELLD